jgi:hypothetical protein
MIITLDNGPLRQGAGAPPTSANIWQLSHIMLVKGKNGHYWFGKAGLSIKSFCNGQAHYDAGGGAYVVNDDSYLILNHDQDYTIEVEPDTPIESFCLFFCRRLRR